MDFQKSKRTYSRPQDPSFFFRSHRRKGRMGAFFGGGLVSNLFFGNLFFGSLVLGSLIFGSLGCEKEKTSSRTLRKASTYVDTISSVKGEQSIVGKSKVHEIDHVIKSMFGPMSNQAVGFGDPKKAEVIWVKGAHVEVLDAETGEPTSGEYLCHSHIKFRPKTFNKRERNKNFGGTTHQNLKLFTLIQGQNEIRLPDGFGIPILSFEDFVFHSMVISNNPVDKERHFQVQSKFDWVAEKDRTQPIKALFRTGISMKVPVFGKGDAPPLDELFANLEPSAKAKPANIANKGKSALAVDARFLDENKGKLASKKPNQAPAVQKTIASLNGKGLGAASSGECALPEQDDPSLNKADVTDSDKGPVVDVNVKSKLVSGKFFGKGDNTMSYHWLIPPGRHRYRYTVRKGGVVPFDTTMHHATAHMHAYADWMELRDKTSGEVIFRFDVTNFPDRIGLLNITHFTSSEGIPLYKKHEYELVAEYNNTTNEPIDAMAIVYMYLYDKKFDIKKASAFEPEPGASSRPAG